MKPSATWCSLPGTSYKKTIARSILHIWQAAYKEKLKEAVFYIAEHVPKVFINMIQVWSRARVYVVV